MYFRELIAQHPDNMRTLLTHTIFNELSNLRNPNNMSLLSVMFQYKPEGAARVGADLQDKILKCSMTVKYQGTLNVCGRVAH